MDKLKTAVVGDGRWPTSTREALADYPGSDFVAVCGRDAAKARAFGEQHRVRPVHERRGDGPPGVQRRGRDTAPGACPRHDGDLRAGAHAIVEKPRRVVLEDCDAMIGAAREAVAHAGHDQPATPVRAGAASAPGDRRRQARPPGARHRHDARLAERGRLPQRLPGAAAGTARAGGVLVNECSAPDRHPAVVHG